MVDSTKPEPLLPLKVPERFAPSVHSSTSDEEDKFEFCNVSDSLKLNYLPNEIYLKKIIVDEFYKQEKYYLNT